MSRRIFTRALLVSTVLGGLSVPTLAEAQSGPPPPPAFTAIDQNGVDLTTGQVLTSPGPVMTIGGNGNQLSYETPWPNLDSPEGSNYGGHLYGASASGLLGDVAVVIGANSETFNCAVTGCPSRQGSGSTLSFDSTRHTWTYTNRAGDVGVFTIPLGNFELPGSPMMVSFTRANGEVLSLAQNLGFYTIPGFGSGWVGRYTSIKSSHGYLVKFTHQSDDFSNGSNAAAWGNTVAANVYNLANSYCDPGTAACSATPLLSITYAKTNPSPGVNTVTMTDQGGRVWGYKTLDISGCCTVLTAIKRPGSTSDNITYTYDTNHKIATATVEGRLWTYSYGVSGTTATMTVADPLGHSRTIVSDLGIGRPTSVTDEMSRTTTYTYDTFSRITKITHPEGNYEQYTLDGRGNVTQILAVPKPGSGLSNITTTASFPLTCSNPKTCNKPTSTTDARNAETDYTYDSTHGGILSVTSPAPTVSAVRPEVRFGYSGLYAWYKNSAATIVSDANPVYKLVTISRCQTAASCSGTSDEAKTSITYQAGSSSQASNLLPVSSTAGSGDGTLAATVAITYDSLGNAITKDGPLSGSADTTRLRYDDARQIVGIVHPDPDGGGPLKDRAERYTYNADGQVTSIERGVVDSQSDADWSAMTVSAQQTNTFASDGTRVRTDLISGGTPVSVTQFSYDGDGLLECSALRMNSATWSSLPSSACTLATTGAAGADRIIKSTYDAAGEVTKVQVAYGTSAQADRMTVTRTANGRIQTIVDGEGNLTTNEYDGFDRLAKVHYPSGSAGSGVSSTTDYDELVYDQNNNITSRHLRGYSSDSTQHIDFTYDSLNRVTAKDLPGSELDVSYSYDNLGRLTSATFPGSTAPAVTFTYDALGRKLTETGPSGTMTSQYDLAGRRTFLSWPDGLYVNYDYLVTGEMTAIRENGATTGIGVLTTYTYDNLGRRTGATRGNGTATSYGFDNVAQLTSLTQNLAGTANDLTLGFSYNPASQITSTTRTNDIYAWTGSADIDRAYTINGLNQMTSVGGGSMGYDARGNLVTAGSNSYTYTAENHLVGGPSGAGLSYDQLGRLTKEGQTGTVAIHFLYDGQEMTGEYTSAGLQRRYVYGSGTDEPVVWYEGSGTTDRRWLHADERGSVIAVSDASGASIGTNTFDEYGVPGSGNLGRFQYTGQAYLPSLGMYYYKSRIYSSRLGRYMQADPTGYNDGPNMYNYVGSDPTNSADPSGLDGEDDIIIQASSIDGAQYVNLPSLSIPSVPTPIILPKLPAGPNPVDSNGNSDDQNQPSDDDIIVRALAAGPPPMGHNLPPPGLPVGRTGLLIAMWCILVCHDSSVYPQILFSEINGKYSKIDRSLTKWTTRDVSNRNIIDDWNYLVQHADKLTVTNNGNIVAQFDANVSVTRYVSSTGQGDTLFLNYQGTLTKYRY